jgi:alkylation response protein AidB-like acyl-CoA dehydrogenase
MVMDNDTLRMNDAGAPAMLSMLVPIADLEIHHTWDVSGLRGTGSEDFTITDVFVPEERTFRLFASERYSDAALYKLPFTYFPAGIATVPLGIARGAIDAFLELATTKVPMRQNRTPLRERPGVQVTVAKAEALLGSARAYFYESMQAVWDEVQSKGEASFDRRATLRNASCHAAIASADAVDLMYNAGGGTSIYSKSLLQRAFRDVHAATQHIGVAPDSMEDVGRIMLGLEPSGPMF